MTQLTPTPFSQVFTQIWELTLTIPDITSMIRPGNFIRYDTNKTQPFKENITASDLPELVLASDGFLGNLRSTSSSTQIIQNYSWRVSTGDFRWDIYSANVTWGLFKALSNWCNGDNNQYLSQLTWNGKLYVKEVRFTDSADGVENFEANRGVRGWASIMRFAVHMYFDTSDLFETTP